MMEGNTVKNSARADGSAALVMVGGEAGTGWAEDDMARTIRPHGWAGHSGPDHESAITRRLDAARPPPDHVDT